MDINTILQSPDALGDSARKWVEVTAEFIGQLSSHNIELNFGPTNDTDVEVDYDAPASAAYKRTYTPITTSEIVTANKDMTEAISGEKWVDGFVTAVQFIMMLAR